MAQLPMNSQWNNARCNDRQAPCRDACVLVRRVIETCRVQQRCASATLTLPCGFEGGAASGVTNAEASVRLLALDDRCARPGGLRATLEMTAPMTVCSACGCAPVCGELTVVVEVVLRARCDTDWNIAGTLCATLVSGQCLRPGSQCVNVDFSATLYLTTLGTSRLPVDGACRRDACAPFFSMPIFPPDGRMW